MPSTPFAAFTRRPAGRAGPGHPRPRRQSLARAGVFALLVLGGVVAGMTDAGAQYFGRNKVQHQDFDFKVLRTEHFDIYYYEEEAEAVRYAARMAERWYTRLSRVLRHELTGRQPLVLYASHPHFQQTNVIGGMIGEGTGGVTESAKRRIVLPFAAGLAETDHVLGHELVHAFQYDILGAGPRTSGAAAALPLWFIEGMAEYLSIGSSDAQTAMWMRDAAMREKLPTIEELDHPRYFPYRYGHALWAYVAGRWGDGITGDALRAAAGGGVPGQSGPSDAVGVVEMLSGLDRKELSAEWHAAINRELVQPVLAREGERAGTRLIGVEHEEEADLNVGPALSPDGNRLAFLSARGRLSVDLYLADAETGKVLRKVVSTAGDPHFDSLQFLNSAGTWDPAGKTIAFAALRSGKPTIALVDADSGRRVREIPVPDADEAFHPAWSPDGRTIAVSVLAGGLSDLVLLDVASGAATRLTRDPFADLQPAWSPDGKSLAYVTDRFSADLETLSYGIYELGRIDVASKQSERIRAFTSGRHTNPQWSADGRSIYFIATPGGIPDVYRMDVTGGTPVPVTRVATGVCGITALSPALSVASRSNRAAFVLYRNGGQSINVVDPSTAAPDTVTAQLDADQLPPRQRRTEQLDRLIDQPTVGLPAPTAEQNVEPYRARLGLDYVGQQFGGVGIGPFGPQAVGGVSFLWSDMLGEHTLASVLQVNGSFEEIGGQVGYINRTKRWNWGTFVQQIPYVTGSYGSGVGIVDGEFAEIQQEVRFRQIDQEVSGVVAYPFSTVQRFELGVSGRRISGEQEVTTRAFSINTGQLLLDEQEEQDLFSPVQLAIGRAALVYDSSIFGATGPVLGQRFRFEVSPTAGDLYFTGAVADFRRYVMPARPWTIAFRALHVGRYGRDAEDDRLGPLFLGQPTLVRGYEWGSLSADECPVTLDGSCPALDRLFGSRIAVANLELRVPLVGAFTGEFDYGPIPLEAFAFADAGAAWASRTSTWYTGNQAEIVRSVGAGLRVNALGFLVFELDAVRPLDRPDKSWRFQFTVAPGF